MGSSTYADSVRCMTRDLYAAYALRPLPLCKPVGQTQPTSSVLERISHAVSRAGLLANLTLRAVIMRLVSGKHLTTLLLVTIVLAASLLSACGTATPADPQGAHVERMTIDSRAVGQQEHVTVVIPPARAPARPRPLLVFLHGRGGDNESELGTQPLFTTLHQLGPRAPVVAFPDGGDHSYWHDRADGDWSRYVSDEVIPQVTRRFHTDPRRVAIGGISMGGFGALDLAERGARHWCAVGAHSPALWQTAGETADGAFDDAEDFAAHDVIAAATSGDGAAVLAAQPLWIDAGNEDPFLPGDHAFVDALHAAGDTNVQLDTKPGDHDGDYWSSRWKEYLTFYAHALADC
jgi:S-formylglutathione hydrolase FrmB